ncbi:FadR/GntR family transcriptional regulator [Microbacterium gorillae]|uniref:FadR/GntR family transcriptional regulator n=1 Tax=Microbacterium gorillae TaxID=1231063 RepID=UPI000590788C|nr:FadR/GntR family transcriptional regulator [Microbacterium gorillae]
MSAVDTAFHGLRALIADGTLSAGDRLPSESELCDRFGVSRSSLREAIRTLAALGVVETRHGSGTYVSSLLASDLLGSLSLTVGLLPLESVLELYELRRVLESHAAGLAAARRDEETVAELSALLDELERTHDDDEQSRLDHLFHMRIVELSGNPALSTLTGVLRTRSMAYRIFTTADAREIKRRSDAGHRAILTAIANRDPVAATSAAAEHVQQTEVWLRKHRPAARSTISDTAG